MAICPDVYACASAPHWRPVLRHHGPSFRPGPMLRAPPQPPPLALDNPLQRPPARIAAKTLQWRPARGLETLVTARPLTTPPEKIGAPVRLLLTLAHPFPSRAPRRFESEPAGGRSPHAASGGPAPFSDTAAGPSIATTAAPPSGTPDYSSVAANAAAETARHSPSANTTAPVASTLSSISFLLVVYPNCSLCEDLVRGSWEVLLPDSSSPGEDSDSPPGRLRLRQSTLGPSQTHIRTAFTRARLRRPRLLALRHPLGATLAPLPGAAHS
jgi:hypothetical protein